jgi:hypothetical protein
MDIQRRTGVPNDRLKQKRICGGPEKNLRSSEVLAINSCDDIADFQVRNGAGRDNPSTSDRIGVITELLPVMIGEPLIPKAAVAILELGQKFQRLQVETSDDRQ